MLAVSAADTVRPPGPAVTPKSVGTASAPSALAMKASTSLVMVLRASDTPRDTDPPTNPPDRLTETAAATAWMSELSLASRATRAATMPAVPAVPPTRSPSMDAFTSTPILFSANTPEPLAASPAVPAPTATDPAATTELMLWPAVAVAVRLPAARALEFFR